MNLKEVLLTMDCEKYKKVFDENNGIVKLSDFTGAGYHNTVIDRLIREGKVIKIRAGFYEWQYEDVISEAVIINKLYPDAIICMDSALYFYDYTERTPNAWHLAVNKNSSKSRFKIDYPKLKIYYIVEKHLKIGISETEFEGQMLSIYNREKTICDIIRYEKKMDKEVFNKAIRSYATDSNKNVGRLIEYAKLMNVEKKTKMIMGMWM